MSLNIILSYILVPLILPKVIYYLYAKSLAKKIIIYNASLKLKIGFENYLRILKKYSLP